MNCFLRRPILRLNAFLLSCSLFTFPAMLLAQTNPPAAPQSPAEKAAIDELDQLNKEGGKFYNKGDFPAALESWQTGLDKAQARKNEKVAALFLNNIGAVYSGLGQNDKALDFYQRALTIKEKIGNPQDIAQSLNNIGLVYRSLGQNDKALDYLQRALTLREKIGNPQEIAASLNNIGGVYRFLGQNDKALDFYQRALTLFEKIDNPQGIATSLNNIGLVYYALGQNDKALEFQQRALTFKEKIGNPQGIATSLNNIGLGYYALGQDDKALDFYQRSLTIREKIGNQSDIAQSLNNIGLVYRSLGQNDKALDYLQRTLTIRERIGSPQDIAQSLNNIGAVYSDLGQNDKALEFQQRALTLKEKIGDQSDIAASLNNIGNVYFDLGQNDKALEFQQRALTIREKIGNQSDIAGSLNNIGFVYYVLGQNDKALDYVQRALTIKEKIGNLQDIAQSLNNIGLVYIAQKRWDKAEDAYSRTRRIFENLTQQVGDPTELADLQQTIPYFYENYAFVLMQQKREGEGLALLEAGRAQGLARQIALNGSDYTAYFTVEEKTQLKQRTADLTASSSLLHAAEANLAAAPAEQRAAFQKQKDDCQKKQADAERKYTSYRDYLFAHYPQFRDVSGERPPTVAELKSLARKNPDTLFLTYAILDEKQTLLFALTEKDGLKSYFLPVGEKELGKLVADWRGAILDGANGTEADAPADQKEEKQAKALYQTLFAPLEKDGLMKPGCYARLVTVATGSLLDLPFAALENGSGKRLIETHTVTSAIALGVSFWRDNPLLPTSDLLCVADPIGKAAPKPTKVALRREGFGALPGARQEGTEIAALFKKERLLVGPAARKADVIKQMAGAKLLHFATHGYLNDKNPLLSSLVLAPEPEGSGDDGVLSAREILNLPMAARLAVLSACETGRGKAAGGEGLQGLAWAFRAAGCPCVVASQWRVDDAATRELMLKFYKGLQAGKRKDDALRDAMLAVKANKPSPFFWAAFQVIGDTAPLE